MTKAIFSRARTPNLNRGTRLGGGVIYPPLGGVIYNPHPFTPPPDPAEEVELFKTNLTQIKKLTAELSPQERKELVSYLALGLQTRSQAEGRDLTMWAGSVLTHLQQEIGAQASQGSGPALFERLLAAGQGWKAVQDFMRTSKLQELKVTERQGVYNLLASLLVKHAKQVSRVTSVPVTPKFLATCSANIASIFDSAFPGYLASGLAPVVAKRLGFSAKESAA